MSKRTFKPGDVAMVTAFHRDDPYRAYYDGRTWRAVVGAFCVDEPTSIRPLVVIDPEDETPEGVSRLCDLLGEKHGKGSRVDIGLDWLAVQEALEAYAAPPRLPEPTGLGAVVEDADGYQWARAVCDDSNGPWCRRDGGARWAGWSYVKAVKVLAAGVQAGDEPLADWERDLLEGGR